MGLSSVGPWPGGPNSDYYVVFFYIVHDKISFRRNRDDIEGVMMGSRSGFVYGLSFTFPTPFINK